MPMALGEFLYPQAASLATRTCLDLPLPHDEELRELCVSTKEKLAADNAALGLHSRTWTSSTEDGSRSVSDAASDEDETEPRRTPSASSLEDFEYPVSICLKNTFLEVPLPRDALLEDFEERQVKSCPGSAFVPAPLELPTSGIEEAGYVTDDETPISRHSRGSPCLVEMFAMPLPAGPLPLLWPHAEAPGLLFEGPPQDPQPWCFHEAGLLAFAAGEAPCPPPEALCPPPEAPEQQSWASDAPAPSRSWADFPVLLSLSEALPSEEQHPSALQPAVPGEPSARQPCDGPLLPSVGSARHYLGDCVPCAFTAKGCTLYEACPYCHTCAPGEHQRRKKEKLAMRRAEVREQRRPMHRGYGEGRRR